MGMGRNPSSATSIWWRLDGAGSWERCQGLLLQKRADPSSVTGRSVVVVENWRSLAVDCWIRKKFGYGSIPIDTFLVGWTFIYQLFWGSLGTRVLTHPHLRNPGVVRSHVICITSWFVLFVLNYLRQPSKVGESKATWWYEYPNYRTFAIMLIISKKIIYL